jgi:chromosome segregation ATPase
MDSMPELIAALSERITKLEHQILAAELIAALSERITPVEHQLSSHVPTIVPELKESITNHDGQPEILLSVIEAKPEIPRAEIDDLRQFAQLLPTELEAMNSKSEKQNEALVARIASVERQISDSLPPITSRLSVCERSLEEMKSGCEGQNETMLARIASVEGKMSDSLSSITSRLTLCERSIVTCERQMNEVRASVEELRTQVGRIDVRRRH